MRLNANCPTTVSEKRAAEDLWGFARRLLAKPHKVALNQEVYCMVVVVVVVVWL